MCLRGGAASSVLTSAMNCEYSNSRCSSAPVSIASAPTQVGLKQLAMAITDLISATKARIRLES